MTERDLSDYRRAPSGEGPLAAQWADKPHRLVYDLCGEVERLRARVAELERKRPWADAGQGNDHNNWFWWVVRSGAALRGVDLRNVLCNDSRVRAALYDICCHLADDTAEAPS